MSGWTSLPPFFQVNSCDLRTVVDNKYSIDTQQGNAMNVLSDQTSAATACMHDPHLENIPLKTGCIDCLRRSGPKVELRVGA